MVPGNVIVDVVMLMVKRGLGLSAAAIGAAVMMVVCMEVGSVKGPVVAAEEEEAAVEVAVDVAR